MCCRNKQGSWRSPGDQAVGISTQCPTRRGLMWTSVTRVRVFMDTLVICQGRAAQIMGPIMTQCGLFLPWLRASPFKWLCQTNVHQWRRTKGQESSDLPRACLHISLGTHGTVLEILWVNSNSYWVSQSFGPRVRLSRDPSAHTGSRLSNKHTPGWLACAHFHTQIGIYQSGRECRVRPDLSPGLGSWTWVGGSHLKS